MRQSQNNDPPKRAPSPEAISKLLYPTHRALREQLFTLLKEPIFQRRHDITVRQHRALTQARIARISQAGFMTGTIATGTSQGSRRYDTVIDCVTLVDHSMETMLGVSFGLFGASVKALGSPSQSAYWLRRIEDLQEVGCFALTELGHGSNVRGLETTARYNCARQTFVLHTPTESAQKYWIGGAADTATASIVFAQLYVGDTNHGIHGFIVRLRDSKGVVENGIQIADCGKKIGLNGVDNGRIWFTQHEIARSALLSRYSDVSASGQFTSSIPSADARFSLMLAALTGGRVGIALTAVSIALLGLTIAIRYSAQRRAFAPNGDVEELPLLFYRSQKRVLMVPLAKAFVYFLCAKDLREDWYGVIDGGVVSKQVHVFSAGYKALFTWFMQDALQAAREACGGQGYKSDNVIGGMKADRDVMLTFEGANGILLQQVSKHLLGECQHAARNGGQFPKGCFLQGLNEHIDEAHLQNGRVNDTEFIQAVLRKREKVQVDTLWKEYQEALRRHKGETFYAFNDCFGVAERTATSFLHRHIYERHLQHMQRASKLEANSAHALQLCGTVWAHSVVTSDMDFLRLECLDKRQVTAMVNGLDGLCDDMADISECLLQGVGFPAHLLAPIAGDFVKHNSRAML